MTVAVRSSAVPPPALELTGLPEAVVRRYRSRSGLTERRAWALAGELERFLRVAAVAPHVAAPPSSLDAVWHAFVLHTELYAQWCNRELGQMIHHSPGDEPMTGAYQATRETALELYGELDAALWPADDAGSDCSYCNDGGAPAARGLMLTPA